MSHHRQYNQFSLGLSYDLISRLSKHSHLNCAISGNPSLPLLLETFYSTSGRLSFLVLQIKVLNAYINGMDETKTKFMGIFHENTTVNSPRHIFSGMKLALDD